MYTGLQAIKTISSEKEKKQMEEAIINYITEVPEVERNTVLRESVILRKAFLNWDKLNLPEEIRSAYKKILIQRKQKEINQKKEIINRFFDKYESYYIELAHAIILNNYRIEDGKIRVTKTLAINANEYPEVAEYIKSNYDHLKEIKESFNSPY